VALATSGAGVAAATTGAPVLPFDCHDGKPHDWSDQQRRWCCEHEDVGCTGGGESNTTLEGCASICAYKGMRASCESRIQWAAWNTYAGEEMPCLMAHALVLRQCSVCSNCTSKAVGCTGDEAKFTVQFQRSNLKFKRLYGDVPASEAARPVATHAGGSTLLLVGLGSCLALFACLALGRTAFRHAVPAAGEADDRENLLDSELAIRSGCDAPATRR